MNDPFAILGVDEDADDDIVRKAYLKQVRTHPPEQDPVRFQEIRAAYEMIEDARDRLGVRLFHACRPDFSLLTDALLQGGQPIYPDEQSMLALLSESLKKFRFPMTPETKPVREK